MSWAPEQYERFRTERKQPFLDLVALIERRPRMRVVDLGCGTGDLTRELHETLGAEETVGIDDSDTMLLKSGHFEGEMLRFERGSIEAFVTDKPAVILSPRGKGNVLLFAVNPMWRMNTPGMYPLVMNAVMNWDKLR